MHHKRASLASTILLGLGAIASLALMSGCATVTLSNLTPTSLPENPSEIYTFTLRATPKTDMVIAPSVAPHLVVDGQNFAMKPSPLGGGIYEFEYQVPAGRQELAYYYLVDYQVQNSNGGPDAKQAYTDLQHATIQRRYVLSLEASRGPVGASIGVLGRGFTASDVVAFNGNPVRTVFASPTSLEFFVPALSAGNYAVTLTSTAGNSPVGTFRIDSTAVTVSPASLSLHAGEQQSLTFSLPSAAPSGGLLLDLTTDVPESVIMPEVTVPAGQTSVTVTIQGGKPGTGSLLLKGYGGGDVTIPVTVDGAH
jgi:hypothetical protein